MFIFIEIKSRKDDFSRSKPQKLNPFLFSEQETNKFWIV